MKKYTKILSWFGEVEVPENIEHLGQRYRFSDRQNNELFRAGLDYFKVGETGKAKDFLEVFFAPVDENVCHLVARCPGIGYYDSSFCVMEGGVPKGSWLKECGGYWIEIGWGDLPVEAFVAIKGDLHPEERSMLGLRVFWQFEFTKLGYRYKATDAGGEPLASVFVEAERDGYGVVVRS
jgi:hypothetical protein